MTLYQKYKNWKHTPNRAPLTLRNIWAFIQGHFRKDVYVNETHAEQIEWRKTQIQPACREKGYCIHCGCDIESKPYEDRPCEGFCYPNFMGKDDWQVFKEYLKNKEIKTK